MSRDTTAFAALGLLTWLGVSSADAQPGSCDKAVATAELNQCSARAFEIADDAMNASYKTALAVVATSAAPRPYDRVSWEKALRASQRAWLAYRDAECKGHVPMSWTGGTGTTSAVFECLRVKTDARTKDLVAIFKAP